MDMKRGLMSSLSIILFGFILLGNAPAARSNQAQTPASLPKAAERIRNEPESVWVEFIQLAIDHKPLNLGQGFPDFAAPKYLVDALHNATHQVDQETVLNHQYTRSFGHPRLVRALRDYYHKLRGFERLLDEKEQILVTVGAYEALFTAIMAFVNPGDEIIIIDPAFDAYVPMVAMAGGRSVFIPLKQGTNLTADQKLTSEQYSIDMAELESKVTNKTRMLVLNTPNNPMGKVYSREELQQLAQVCIKNNILVLADEVYEQFYYDHNQHTSMASLAGMWERTITIGSAGKTFSVTGWKIGWAYGPSHLLRYLQLVHQTAVYAVATPLQEAVARALEREMSLVESGGEPLYWRDLRAELKTKRDKMARVLAKAQMRPIVPQGGYFMLVDFSQLGERYPEYKSDNTTTRSTVMTNDYKFARWLSRVKHLQAIPGGAFYSPDNKSLGADLLRLCFIKSQETLAKFEQLINALS